MAIAFFDLDGTLLSVNSAWLWARDQMRLGHIPKRQAASFAWTFFRYRLGIQDVRTSIEKLGSPIIKGQKESDLRAGVHAFYDSTLRAKIRPGALRQIAHHREKKDALVILTSSLPYVSEMVMRDLNLDDIVCTQLHVESSGYCTGRVHEPMCYGPGKVELAERFVKQRGCNLSDTCFYTDSASDLPMMNRVGRPIAVNPDPTLKRIAKQKKWEIADWNK